MHRVLTQNQVVLSNGRLLGRTTPSSFTKNLIMKGFKTALFLDDSSGHFYSNVCVHEKIVLFWSLLHFGSLRVLLNSQTLLTAALGHITLKSRN